MYIVLEFGIPSVCEELSRGERMNTLAVMAETWKQGYAFSSEIRYVCVPSKKVRIGWFRQILAHTVYNPWTDVKTEWQESGSYCITEIVGLVESGLADDDDIIQQWFGADEVLKLLRSANTFAELCDRVRCVCGEYENDARLRSIVDSVIGPNA